MNDWNVVFFFWDCYTKVGSVCKQFTPLWRIAAFIDDWINILLLLSMTMWFLSVCCFTMVSQDKIRQQWRSIILISSCAGSSPASRLVACVRNAMASVSSVTHTCAHVRLSVSAMSATMVHSREGVWSAEESVSQTPTTARSVPSRRRTGMVVPRSSISEVPRQISSTSARSMVLRRDDPEDGAVCGSLWPCVLFYCTEYWYNESR